VRLSRIEARARHGLHPALQPQWVLAPVGPTFCLKSGVNARRIVVIRCFRPSNSGARQLQLPPIRHNRSSAFELVATLLVEAYGMGPAKARVLALLASGVTCTKDMSTALCISAKRVDEHVSEMMREARFASRGDLAVAAAHFVASTWPRMDEVGGESSGGTHSSVVGILHSR
jgi:hypothetical protein